MNNLNHINAITMYSGRDAQGNIKFDDSIESMLGHAKTTASDAVACIQSKTTAAAQNSFSNAAANSVSAPAVILLPVVPHVGRVKFNTYNFNFGPTNHIVNNTTVVNNTVINQPMGRPQPLRQMPAVRRSQNEKKDNEMGMVARVVIGLVAAVVGGYALFRAGEDYQRIRGSAEEKTIIKANIKSLDKMQLDFKASSKNQRNNLHLEIIGKILHLEKGIFSRIQRDSVIKLAIMVGVAAAAGIALAGALAASYALVIASLAVGAVVGGGALFYLGFSNITKDNARDGQLILNLLAQLSKVREDYGQDKEVVNKSTKLDEIIIEANKNLNESLKKLEQATVIVK